MMLYNKTTVQAKTLIAKHSIIVITDDPTKDAAGVKESEDKAIQIARTKIDLQQLYEWTDDCASQTKGKHSFFDISFADLKITKLFWDFPWGECLRRAWISGQEQCHAKCFSGRVITNAKDPFSYCQSKLQLDEKVVTRHGETCVSSRQFLFMNQEDVNHAHEMWKLYQERGSCSPWET